jgi:endonuclease/exonuclease/phosphatase family metal-dependent hydrolase
VPLLVRTWNVFHGRTSPETWRIYLEKMVRLAAVDRPDVLALQEVPVWALACLERWSGMRATVAVTKRALLGPLGRRLQVAAPKLIRSPWTGQANALLVGERLRPEAKPSVFELNPGVRAERRVAQIFPVEHEGGRILLVNLHASKEASRARAELGRLADALAAGGPTVVCGDLNIPATGLPDFSAPVAGIDQILVRGLAIESGPASWPDERRSVGDRVLSDHAPVEATVSCAETLART